MTSSISRIDVVARNHDDAMTCFQFDIRVHYRPNNNEFRDDAQERPALNEGMQLFGSYTLDQFEMWHSEVDQNLAPWLICSLIERRVGRHHPSL